MPDLRRWIHWVGACAALLLPGGAGAAQLELVSRSIPELRSDTAAGLSTTDNFPDSSRFTYANPPRLSADGRWMVFSSEAPNLVEGQIDSNGSTDVFLHDRQTGTTILVSRAAGTATRTASHGSFRPSISADGRYIAFLSWGIDLVPGQIDEAPFSYYDEQDVFLFDRVTGSMVLISRKHGTAATGASGQGWDPFVSADGRFVAYLSSANDLISGQVDASPSEDLFLYDRVAGTNRLVSHRSGSTQTAAGAGAFTISGNGEWIAFLSAAGDVVPGQSDPNNLAGWGYDLFLYQVSSGAMTLVTHASGSPTTTANIGSESTDIPSISADGSRLVFLSGATDLVAGVTETGWVYDVFLFDRTSGTTTLISAPNDSPAVAAGGMTPVISSDGTRIAFFSPEPLASGQTASEGDVYLYTVASGSVTLVSRSSSSPASGGDDGSINPSLSGDGTRVLFQSTATNLVPGQIDTEGLDLFLADLSAGTLVLVNHASGSAVTPAAGPGGTNFGAGAAFLSENGGFASFFSMSDDMVTDLRDLNGRTDVFLYNAATATNQAISVHAPSFASVTGNGQSFTLSMSADGRFVVFVSQATDLVPGQNDRNAEGEDIFLEDRLSGEIVLVSHTPGSSSATGDRPSLSATISRDGSFVVFSSSATDLIPGQIDNNSEPDVFLYERASGLVTLLSHADGAPSSTGNNRSGDGLISGDGRFIAFSSRSTDLVPGLTETNGFLSDVYLHDRVAGTTILVSHAAGAATTTANEASGSTSLSADGRFLVFVSYATDLIAGQIDTNGGLDIFLYDQVSGTTTLVSHASGLPGTAANASSSDARLSANGGFIVFSSGASNLVSGQTSGGGNLYLFDRAAGTTALISHASDSLVTPADGYAVSPTIDDNGDFIAFRSNAPDLVEGQIDQTPPPFQGDDIFLYDRGTATNILVSHIPGSVVTPANNLSYAPALSGNGAYVTYYSTATDLVAGNPPLTGVDVYAYNRLTRTTTLLSQASVPPTPPGFGPPPPTYPQGPPLISQDGRTVVFASVATNLVAQDFNGVADVFRFSDPMPADFFLLVPCRRLDTRQAGQGPALSSGVPRTVLLHGSCGVPDTARAVVVNVTVTQPSGSGYLTAFQGDFLIPPAVSTVNFAMGRTRTNNAIVSLAADGTLALQPLVGGGGTVHVVIDVFGYFE